MLFFFNMIDKFFVILYHCCPSPIAVQSLDKAEGILFIINNKFSKVDPLPFEIFFLLFSSRIHARILYIYGIKKIKHVCKTFPKCVDGHHHHHHHQNYCWRFVMQTFTPPPQSSHSSWLCCVYPNSWKRDNKRSAVRGSM